MRKAIFVFSFFLLLLFPGLMFSQTMNVTSQGSPAARSSVAKQQALGTLQLTGGRIQLLQQRTGLSKDQIVQSYYASGAKNFGQFVCAMLVSQRLGVKAPALLEQLRTGSVGEGLARMGVDPERGRTAVREAVGDMVASKALSTRTS